MAKLISQLRPSLFHPSEISAAFRLKFGGYIPKERKGIRGRPLQELTDLNARDFCYAGLNRVSRSFAVVIQKLPVELRDPICVFYLVLRGLDTVEDDMSREEDTSFVQGTKLPLLRTFYQRLERPGWNNDEFGFDDEKTLLVHFDKVIGMYSGLKPLFQEVISDICRRMGNGMADYNLKKEVASSAEYDEYCHYVAGLVGHGLSDLFIRAGLQDTSIRPTMANGEFDYDLSNQMGLFLQKVNITRDYVEDLRDNRTFYPRDVWSKYSKDGTLGWFHANPTSERSLALLQEMISNALQHIPASLEYMSKITDPDIFQFCAIPQVMAIATLQMLYNNTEVFIRDKVKIRKGLSAKLMLDVQNYDDLKRVFRTFGLRLRHQIKPSDACAERSIAVLDHLNEVTSDVATTINERALGVSTLLFFVMLFLSAYHGFYRLRQRNSMLISGEDYVGSPMLDFGALIGIFISLTYFFGIFGLHSCFRDSRKPKTA